MGTKRMWLRRFLRIGDTVGSGFRGIGKGLSWYWKEVGGFGTFIILFIGTFLTVCAFGIYHSFHDDKYADNASITTAMKQDWCMKTNVPLWPEKLRGKDAGPVTYGDLYGVRAACDKRLASDAALEIQAKVLK